MSNYTNSGAYSSDNALSSSSSSSSLALAQDLFSSCTLENPDSVEHLLICLTQHLIEKNQANHEIHQRNMEYSKNVAILISASLAFFMQAGFAMVCAGSVRRKNLQNTMLKNLLDACGASIAFYSVGYAFAFGDSVTNPNPFIGTTNFFLNDVHDVSFWLFQYAFSAASATIVAGTLAERCQMSAYFYYTIFLSGFVYPVVVHAFWSPYGFLSPTNNNNNNNISGVVDIAGGGVVHVTGGVTALVATWVLGPRRGRFHDEQTGELLENPKPIKGHNIGLQLLGTLILWFGWYGFNSGSALVVVGNDGQYGDILATLAGTNTTLSAGAAGLAALFVNYVIEQYKSPSGNGKYDLIVAMNGVLSGLVAVTAGCAVIEPWSAVVIGIISGILYLIASWGLIQCRLDDAVDAIPVHMINGIWGVFAVGLFASPRYLEMAYGSSSRANHDQPAQVVGLFYTTSSSSSSSLLGAQCIGILFIIGWTCGMMLPFFICLKRLGSFRASAVEEVLGLDRAYFGGLQQGGSGGGDIVFGDGNEITEEQVLKLSKELERAMYNNKNHHHSSNNNNSLTNNEDNNNNGNHIIKQITTTTTTSANKKNRSGIKKNTNDDNV